MISLFMTILCSTLNHLLLKGFQKRRILILPAVVTNYLVCVGVGYLFLNPAARNAAVFQSHWFGFTVAQGVLLIGSFLLISRTTRINGVSIAALSTRLAVIVPTAAAFFLYGDAATILKLTGIALAAAALYLSCADNGASLGAVRGENWLLPAVLFTVFGLNMTLAKWVQHHYLDDMTYHAYLTLSFGFAFLTGVGVLAVAMIRGKSGFGGRDLLAGLLLGINNYGAIYFMLRAIGQEGWESSVVFPTISVSVVVSSFAAGYAIFHETISRTRLAALGVGILAILLINA